MTSDPYRTGIRVDAEPESRIPDCIRYSPFEYLRREKAKLEALVPPKEYQELAREGKIEPPTPWHRYLPGLLLVVLFFVVMEYLESTSKNYRFPSRPFVICVTILFASLIVAIVIAFWQRYYSPRAKAYQAWLDAGRTWSRTYNHSNRHRLEVFPLVNAREGNTVEVDVPLLPIVYKQAIRDLVRRYVGELGPEGQFLTGSGSGPLHKRLNFIDTRLERLSKIGPPPPIDEPVSHPTEIPRQERATYQETLHEARARWQSIAKAIGERQQTLLEYAGQLASTVHAYGMDATLTEQAQVDRLWTRFNRAYVALDEYLASLPLDREDSVPSDAQLNNIPRLQDAADEVRTREAPRLAFKKRG